MNVSEHEQFMAVAMEEATLGAAAGEQPFGGVVVRDGTIVARARSRKVGSYDATAHAEILAVGQATQALRTRSLAGSTFYATCEPCPMCCGAIINSGISILVIGARFAKMRRFAAIFGGYHEYSVERLAALTGSNLQVVSGIREAECEALYRGTRITVNG